MLNNHKNIAIILLGLTLSACAESVTKTAVATEPEITGPQIRNSHISGGEVAEGVAFVALCAAMWASGIPCLF